MNVPTPSYPCVRCTKWQQDWAQLRAERDAERERADLAKENLSAALMQRDEETERADRAEDLLSRLKLDFDLDDAYRERT